MQRPYLDPALPVLWRTPDHVQVGLDPRHAYAFAAAPADTPALLRLLTGTNTWEALRHQVRTRRSEATLRRLVDLLDGVGMLQDGAPADRWQPAWVEVVGDGATARVTTEVLRTAGVGRVHRRDTPAVPGPDLVVVTADRGRRMGLSEQLMAAGSPHLWCHLRDGRAVVGPLVRPGRTSCLRCQDLHRTDNDPAWPRLALAWEEQPATPSAAAATVAGMLSARQALTWLHGAPCATLDGTLEEQPDGSIAREHWAPHPGCGCTWPDGAPSDQDAV
jgi:hypothetical protein